MSHFLESKQAVAMLVVVWSVVLANMAYCFYRILTSKRQLGGEEDGS